MIAIIPAAGRGVRMSSVTAGAPKEALPLGNATVLDRVIREAQAAVEDVTVVSSAAKPQIDGIAKAAGARVAHQQGPAGLADAIFSAQADGDALILLGDTVIAGTSPVERMAGLIYRGIDGAIAVATVPEELVSQYGIADVDDFGNITRLREKPPHEETHSNWAIAARYAFSGALMAFLERAYGEAPPEAGEVSFTGLLQQAIEAGFTIKAVALSEESQRLDCGDPDTYRVAQGYPWPR